MAVGARDLSFRGATGLKLVATETGSADGPAIFLLHGGGQTRHSWDATAKAIAEQGGQALAIDMRGHGDSDWAPDGRYELSAFADDLRAIIDEVGGAPVLVGASLGGLASILACGEEPRAALSALILVDIVPWMEKRGGEQVVGFMRGTADGFDSFEDAADAIAEYLPHRPRPTSPEGLSKNLRTRDGRWYWHWDPGFVRPQEGWDMDMINTRLSAAIARIDVPIMLIRGAKSEIVSQAAADKFRALLPRAQVIDIDGAHHMVAGDDNDAFLAAIAGFIGTRVPAMAVNG